VCATRPSRKGNKPATSDSRDSRGDSATSLCFRGSCRRSPDPPLCDCLAGEGTEVRIGAQWKQCAETLLRVRLVRRGTSFAFVVAIAVGGCFRRTYMKMRSFLDGIEGVVTRVDRRAKTMSIRLADGSRQTLRLTERAASMSARTSTAPPSARRRWSSISTMKRVGGLPTTSNAYRERSFRSAALQAIADLAM
jgi:hypothetical protein